MAFHSEWLMPNLLHLALVRLMPRHARNNLSNSPPGQRQVMDMPRRLAVEHSFKVEPVRADESQLKLASR